MIDRACIVLPRILKVSFKKHLHNAIVEGVDATFDLSSGLGYDATWLENFSTHTRKLLWTFIMDWPLFMTHLKSIICCGLCTMANKNSADKSVVQALIAAARFRDSAKVSPPSTLKPDLSSKGIVFKVQSI